MSCATVLFMADETQKFDARLAEGVAYFEQMLEIMPDDRTTLEFLVVAYDQMGEREKSQKALVSLAKLLIKENDVAALEGLLPRLEKSDWEPAKALSLKVRTLTAPAPDLTPEKPKELTKEEETALEAQRAVKAEMNLVAMLQEGGVLNDADAAAVRSHLEMTPSDGRFFLISALQILEKENQPLCEKSLEFLADRFAAPPVPLAAFDVNAALVKSCPERLVRLRGVVPFAKLGAISLVAVLNPADEVLRAAVEEAGPCRFFLAEPSAVEQAIGKVYGGEGG